MRVHAVKCIKMRACKQRQHDSELINDDDYADLKRIVISEAKKTFEATERKTETQQRAWFSCLVADD